MARKRPIRRKKRIVVDEESIAAMVGTDVLGAAKNLYSFTRDGGKLSAGSAVDPRKVYRDAAGHLAVLVFGPGARPNQDQERDLRRYARKLEEPLSEYRSIFK